MDRRGFLTGSGGLIALASTSAVAGGQSALEKAHVASAAIHRIQADGVSVFYREAGPVDAPVVLLLHGFTSQLTTTGTCRSLRLPERLVLTGFAQNVLLGISDRP